MATRTLVYKLCDFCLQEASEDQLGDQNAEEVVVAIGALKPRVMDLCEPHRKEFIDPLRELLAHLPTVDGRATLAKKAARGEAPAHNELEEDGYYCKMDDCNGAVPHSNLKSLRGHIRNYHEMSKAEYDARFGTPVRGR